jgi:hypothetical protein
VAADAAVVVAPMRSCNDFAVAEVGSRCSASATKCAAASFPPAANAGLASLFERELSR